MRAPRRGSFLRDNALSLFFAVIFGLALLGQALTGWAAYNNEQVADGLSTVSLFGYLTSASFVLESDVAELAERVPRGRIDGHPSVFLRQRGSPESKPVGEPHEKTGTSG